ncbi:probable receptor-like protein kinase At1g30570 [Typha latifolia]|uniref:probable receptor-like protein kinase At1g30570 n=1 Tax=Typha latifolia TaxID=4733 RepID=UPI003C2F1E08
MSLSGLLLVVLGSMFLGIGHAQVKPILVNCGSDSSIEVDGRKWAGDSATGDNFTMTSPGVIASTATISGESVYGSLYQTARIFNMSSSYNFSVIPGNYIVRLHFCPFFAELNVNESLFDVTANNLKLVAKFNVPGEIYWKNLQSNSSSASLVKEYFLNISSNELWIELSPDSGSFAFVNAIEVIPVLDNLFRYSFSRVGGGALRSLFSPRDQGVETMYRLNVGGPNIESKEDPGFWRRWDSDERFMFSVNAAYTVSNSSNVSYSSINDSSIAPLLVYQTARVMTDNQVLEKRFNVSWKFNVDPNYDYLVRMHFCELVYDKPNQRKFKIYINNKTASESYDVLAKAGGKNKAFHEDYVDSASQLIDTLWVQLSPDSSMGASGTDALLNGLEIFKVSRNGNLAHASERINSGTGGTPVEKPTSKALWIGIVAGVLSVAIISLFCAVLIFFFVRKKKAVSAKNTLNNPPGFQPLFLHGTMAGTTNARASASPLNDHGSMASYRTGRRFSIAEIRAATKNFDETLVIGTGGFGKVYKGEIEEGNLVAIKRAHRQSQQGLKEFETEIGMLAKLRHRHLVSMIGYCDEQKEMILVYEYMANGTFRSHLFGSALPPLTWKQRLEACIGAARGLHYLHTGAEGGIIHRDVKSTNILLDENFVAKMADFGLSKDGPALEHTHVSTAVKGSFGYLDPEYFRRQQLTEKSDVYSFGVVLFEVVCARPVINPTLPRDQINLAEWAVRRQRKKELETIIDPRLEGNYSVESLKKFGEIAEKCLADEGKNRPTMGEVLWHLEYVLQLHQAYLQIREREHLSGSEEKFPDVSLNLLHIEKEEEEACRSADGELVENKVEGH